MYLLQYIYYFILVLALAQSIRCSYIPGLFYVRCLLAASVITEAASYISNFYFDAAYYWIYSIYLVLELIFIMMYFHAASQNKTIKKYYAYLATIYVLIAIVYWSVSPGSFFTYPTDLYNLLGIIVIIVSLYELLNITPISNVPIFRRPIFWMASGFLLFYSGNFIMNFLHQYILTDPSMTALKVRHVLLKGLNYILYSFIIIALLCNGQKRVES